MRAAPLGRPGGGGERGLGGGELDQHVGGGEERIHVVGGGEAHGLEPGQRAQVLSQRRVARPLQSAGQGDAFGLQHLAQIGPAHPPGTAHDPDPHPSPPPRTGEKAGASGSSQGWPEAGFRVSG